MIKIEHSAEALTPSNRVGEIASAGNGMQQSDSEPLMIAFADENHSTQTFFLD
jgi:hypothetical protein